MDCSPPGSYIHRILQARMLERVAVTFSRESSKPRIEPASSALQADSSLSEPPGTRTMKSSRFSRLGFSQQNGSCHSRWEHRGEGMLWDQLRMKLDAGAKYTFTFTCIYIHLHTCYISFLWAVRIILVLSLIWAIRGLSICSHANLHCSQRDKCIRFWKKKSCPMHSSWEKFQ